MGDDQHQQIQHFSHHHPLMLKEELEQNKNDIIGHPPVFCDGCEDQVLGPSYSCHQCPNKLFILHKSCAELPREIHHLIHGKHQLVLLLTSITQVSRGQNNIHCDACQQDCMGSFIYHCLQCDFNLDLKCASNWRNIVEYSSHNHIFTVLKKPQCVHHFACDVCGEGWHHDKDGTKAESLYMCSICQLLVHKKCCWLPSHVKIATHQHPLKLTWCFEDIYPKGDLQYFCQICLGNMDKRCAVYYCHEEAGCFYVAHNTCATWLSATKPPDVGD